MQTQTTLPLATRMRPQTLAEFSGQAHLLSPGKPLKQAIERGYLHSLIFWGPPGVGKTTLAQLLATQFTAEFIKLSAVLAGVKDIRQVVEGAKQRRETENKATVLFIDEIHRFNKAQQDVLLPFVEEGTLILMGATTENPSFALNNALLSRCRVYVLKSLTSSDLEKILQQALADKDNGLGQQAITIAPECQQQLISAADGDARQLLNILEITLQLVEPVDAHSHIQAEHIATAMQQKIQRFDKGGDIFYEQISALHKSVRGSAPDAALYWFARMIDGGCDPRYILRRVVRMASEDIGNADPRGLSLAIAAWDTYDRLGSPEGELAIGQAIAYLACAPKSNAVYMAFNNAYQDAKKSGSLPVPMHLCNAPTKMMQGMDYGKNYRYAHDEPNAYAAGEKYFPPELGEKQYYHPTDRGLEIKIQAKLTQLRTLDKKKVSSHD